MMSLMTLWKQLVLTLVVYTPCEACRSSYGTMVICNASYGTWIDVFDDIQTVTGCVALCHFRSTCWSVLYHPGSQECKLNAELADVAQNNECDFVHAWISKSPCRSIGVLGAPCKTGLHCSNADNMECFEDTCACNLGYTVQNSTCIYECGSRFDVYLGYSISGFNDLSLAYSMTAQECIDICVSERNFMCRSVDWSPNACYLSTETRFTQPQAEYIGEYDHYIRHCA